MAGAESEEDVVGRETWNITIKEAGGPVTVSSTQEIAVHAKQVEVGAHTTPIINVINNYYNGAKLTEDIESTPAMPHRDDLRRFGITTRAPQSGAEAGIRKCHSLPDLNRLEEARIERPFMGDPKPPSGEQSAHHQTCIEVTRYVQQHNSHSAAFKDGRLLKRLFKNKVSFVPSISLFITGISLFGALALAYVFIQLFY